MQSNLYTANVSVIPDLQEYGIKFQWNGQIVFHLYPEVNPSHYALLLKHSDTIKPLIFNI